MRAPCVVLQRTAKKYTKNYNACTQPLFFSLNPLFSDVLVAIAVVDFLNSLIGTLRIYDGEDFKCTYVKR